MGKAGTVMVLRQGARKTWVLCLEAAGNSLMDEYGPGRAEKRCAAHSGRLARCGTVPLTWRSGRPLATGFPVPGVRPLPYGQAHAAPHEMVCFFSLSKILHHYLTIPT